MGRWTISAPVGPGQPNRRGDVLIVQQLLNRARQDDPHGATLVEDGEFGSQTQSRLLRFQAETVHLRQPDGIVGLPGPTIAALKRASPPTASGQPASPDDALAAALHRRAAASKATFKVAWINRALPAARLVKAKWGVPIAVTLAQGALESNWGRTAPGNVYFGVKGKATDGGSIAVATHEVIGGVSRAETDAFRSYDSLESSADDYGRFLATNQRYAAAFNYRNDPDMFIRSVAQARYATDPRYEKKIKSIMAANGLKDYDQAAPARPVYSDAASIGNFG